MDKVKYINHLGETLDLRSNNIMSSYFALKDFTLSMTNSKLTGEEKNVSLPMVCRTKEIANELVDVLEKDSINNVYGKFYINDWYINVMYRGIKIIGEYNGRIKLEISLFAEDTIFTKETTYILTPTSSSTSSGLNFPFNFPFTFGADRLAASSIRNTELLDADFILKINKPVSEVNVTIGKNSYFIDAPIYDGETFILNTAEKEVYKETPQGITSMLGAADDTGYIFNTISNGDHSVVWAGNFPLYLTLLEHRRTPKWI